jgi:DNA-directed RNA polymerase subunit omega
MDPLVVFDCDKRLPNRFVLARAAAARARALKAGMPPRIAPADISRADLALREIAAGVFELRELEAFLPSGRRPLLLAGPDELCGSDSSCKDAAAPVSQPRDTVH